MPTATLSFSYRDGNVTINTNTAFSEEGSSGINGSVITKNTSDNVINFICPTTTPTTCIFYCTGADLTVETNASNASGGQTISLTAGSPIYYPGGGLTISNAITKLYVTNASTTTDAVLYVSAIYEPVSA